MVEGVTGDPEAHCWAPSSLIPREEWLHPGGADGGRQTPGLFDRPPPQHRGHGQDALGLLALLISKVVVLVRVQGLTWGIPCSPPSDMEFETMATPLATPSLTSASLEAGTLRLQTLPEPQSLGFRKGVSSPEGMGFPQ